MSAERDNADCTLAVCLCGRAVFAAVSETLRRDKAAQRDLGELVADPRFTIKHLPVSDVRQHPFGCECPKSETLDLFPEREP